MWNEPSPDEIARLPQLYSTEGTSLDETLIHLHFFLGGSDWYVAEYDPHERLFFGYAILNNWVELGEWGLFSYDELRRLRTPQGQEVDRDLHWTPRPARDEPRIAQ